MKKSQNISGTLILEKIEFSKCVHKKVISNNKTSSKVTVPKEWEGKEVYVILKEK